MERYRIEITVLGEREQMEKLLHLLAVSEEVADYCDEFVSITAVREDEDGYEEVIE